MRQVYQILLVGEMEPAVLELKVSLATFFCCEIENRTFINHLSSPSECLPFSTLDLSSSLPMNDELLGTRCA